MASRGSKTGGGVGTNQHQIKGRSVDHDTAAAGRARAGSLDHDTGFVYNGDPDDLDQVTPHFEDYADAVQQAAASDETFRRHVEQMRGMIPGIAGPDEDTALRLLGKMWNADWERRGIELAEHHYDTFELVYNEMVAAGNYPYNDAFRGRIPGLDAETDKRPGVYGTMQDHVIYVMQGMRSRKETQAQVDAFIAEGAAPIDPATGAGKYAKVMCYGFHLGGTGIKVYENVTVRTEHGWSDMFIVPKGRRTGEVATGTIIGIR